MGQAVRLLYCIKVALLYDYAKLIEYLCGLYVELAI